MDFIQYVRSRNYADTIKIGVIELYSNGKELCDYKPFTMSPHPTYQPYTDHADNVIKVIRKYVPNAEIHLVPSTLQGRQYLIEQGIKLVNVSLGGYAANSFYTLADNAFLVIAAGNDGSEGESQLAQIEKACAVGAVDSNFQPQYYSSYGEGVVKTCAVTGLNIYTGATLHGTSFAAPVITGLLAQWYIWYFNQFNTYPTISQSNEFVIKNSHDIFEDAWDLKTGYGLLRLPKYFEAKKFIFEVGNPIAKEIKYKENEPSTEKNIQLMVTPKLENGRTVVGASDITDACVMSRYWSGVAEYGRSV